MPVAGGQGAGSGGSRRPLNDTVGNIIWAQRIEKEEAVNGRVKTEGFSIRAAMGVADVPAKFKPGHMDPQEAARTLGFDPAAVGWDPQGPEAREFRRSYDAQNEGPRSRHAYPETANHEIGWLLAPRGNMAERVERVKLRLGVAWPHGPPASFSEVSAAQPLADLARSELSATCPTGLSCTAPSELSRCSASQPSRREGPEPSTASKIAAPSELLRSGTHQVGSQGDFVAAARYSRTKSLPALGKGALVKRLSRHEDAMERALNESREYLNQGPIGQRWNKYLNKTDVTDFENEFIKQNLGVPLYKMNSR